MDKSMRSCGDRKKTDDYIRARSLIHSDSLAIAQNSPLQTVRGVFEGQCYTAGYLVSGINFNLNSRDGMPPINAPCTQESR
jgi:hypothetical protein